MIDEKYIDLMNREIDGLNSTGESAELKEYLAHNPEAHAYYNGIADVSRMLDQVGEAEPPPRLRKYIMNSIPPLKKVKKFGFIRIPEWLYSRNTLKYAFVFAAGLAAGVIVFSLKMSTMNNQVDISDLYGTMLKSDRSQGERLDINTGAVQGSIVLGEAKNDVLAEVMLNSNLQIEVKFDFNRNDLRFDGFKNLGDSKNSFKLERDFVQLTHLGENRYILAFESKSPVSSPLSVKIYSMGSLIYQSTLLTHKKEG